MATETFVGEVPMNPWRTSVSFVYFAFDICLKVVHLTSIQNQLIETKIIGQSRTKEINGRQLP